MKLILLLVVLMGCVPVNPNAPVHHNRPNRQLDRVI